MSYSITPRRPSTSPGALADLWAWAYPDGMPEKVYFKMWLRFAWICPKARPARPRLVNYKEIDKSQAISDKKKAKTTT